MFRKTMSIVAAATALLAWGAPAAAQEYPSRPVRLIVALAAGGGGDVLSRSLAEELRKSLGQPVIVENRPGGNENIGTRACIEAPPDGYTICVLSSEPMVYNQFLFSRMSFDPDKDLEPVIALCFNTLSMVANSSLKVKTVSEMVALSKSKPGTLSYGTFSFQLAYFMEKLKQDTGADIVRVPFRGGGELVNAVLAGSTPIGLMALSNMVPQLQAGLINLIAVNSEKRSPLFPDAPTFVEARGGEQIPSSWFGLFVPVGTPKAIKEKLADAIGRIMEEPNFRQRIFTARAIEPLGMKHDEFVRFIRDDRRLAERIVKAAGHTPQ